VSVCSIAGFIMTGTARPLVAQWADLAHAIAAGAERGRDCWGVSTSEGEFVYGMGVLDVERDLPRLLALRPCRWAIANTRAEPTTEHVAHKGPDDVQPFRAEGWTVAHNGTIANDAELRDRLSIVTKTRIDSAVLAPVFARLSPPLTVRDVLENVVTGSFAVAVGHGDDLTLAVNYRPLYLARGSRCVQFASAVEQLDLRNDRAMPALDRGWMRVPPYSVVTFTTEGQPMVNPLRTRRDTRRVLVVCSGGLDSTVAATVHARRGHDVTLLHFTYGCRAEQREVKAVRDVAATLGAQVMLVDMRDLFTNVIGGSPLTNTGASFAEGEAGAEFAHEWVPARNLILLAVATGIAEAHGFSTLVLGNNIEEAGAYPDNEQEFIRLLNDVMPYAVAADKLVTIDMPVGGLVKHEIVKLGHELHAPIAESWSCYNGGDVHCGNCGPCFMRRRAHTMLGIPDPTVYADESAVPS
jgi:7-cyano-7-deazaguanine synthase